MRVSDFPVWLLVLVTIVAVSVGYNAAVVASVFFDHATASDFWVCCVIALAVSSLADRMLTGSRALALALRYELIRMEVIENRG